MIIPIKNDKSFSLVEMRYNIYRKAEEAVVPAVITTRKNAHLFFRPLFIEHVSASGSVLDWKTRK